MHMLAAALKALALMFFVSVFAIAFPASAKEALGINGQTANLKNESLTPQAAEKAARHLKAGWQIPLIGGTLKPGSNIWNASREFIVSGKKNATPAPAPVKAIVPEPVPAPAGTPAPASVAPTITQVPQPVAETQTEAPKPAAAASTAFSVNEAGIPVTQTPRSARHVDLTSAPSIFAVPVEQNWWSRQQQHLQDVWTWSTKSWTRGIAVTILGLISALVAAMAGLFLFMFGRVELDYLFHPEEYEVRPLTQLWYMLTFWKNQPRAEPAVEMSEDQEDFLEPSYETEEREALNPAYEREAIH
jgi:hypothetical protein